MIETNTLQYSSIQYSELIQLLNEINQRKSLPTTPLFGTDGIRGCVGVDKLLNSSLAWQVGFWTGQTFRAQSDAVAPVILGQDSRNSSNMLSEALTKGLTAAGVEVWNLGLCPTPAVAYLTKIHQTMGGIMISASHVTVFVVLLALLIFPHLFSVCVTTIHFLIFFLFAVHMCNNNPSPHPRAACWPAGRTIAPPPRQRWPPW